MRKRKPLM